MIKKEEGLLEAVLGDEALRKKYFPVTEERIFLAHAGVAPLPQAAVDAIASYLSVASRNDQESGNFWDVVKETRKAAAALLKASPEEIALIGPTALGLNLVASGLEWNPGEEVVFYPDDYPANVYPWQNLERKGVRLVRLEPPEPGQITPELVLSHVSAKTRLVALSSCHFLTGFRLDYRSIGSELRRRGILFCLDGIQSLGATEIETEHVDFLSADSHKWMLGPSGAGIFYVKQEHFEKLRPAVLGSWNVHSPGFVAQPEITFPSHGQRYEAGSLNGLGIVGMKASLDLLLGIGVSSIEKRLLHLRAILAEGARRRGYQVAGDGAPEQNRSGIVSIQHPDRPMKEIFRRLQEENIVASLRWNRSREAVLRFSPHFYNTEPELERVLENLG